MLNDKDLHGIYNDGAQTDHISGLKMVWERAQAWVYAEIAGIRAEEQAMFVKKADLDAHLKATDPEKFLATIEPVKPIEPGKPIIIDETDLSSQGAQPS